MKKWMMAVLSCAAFSMSGFAEEESEGRGYIGVKGGPLIFSQEFDYKDGINLGLLGGYHFSEAWAVEGEITTSVNEPNSSDFGDINVFTLGVYGVFRSSGKIYFKGKAGILYEYLEAEAAGFPIYGDGIGISLGLGGGWRITDSLSTEIEFQTIEADISMLSLGVLYWF